VSILVACWPLPLSSAVDETRHVAVARGEVVSVGPGVSRLDPLTQAESPVQHRGLGRAAWAVLAEPEPEAGPVWSCALNCVGDGR